MKLTYAPIVERASGRFGGMVFSHWQGVELARRFIPPAQPRSLAQVEQRNLFRNLNRIWLELARQRVAPWGFRQRAAGVPGTARNFFIGANATRGARRAELREPARPIPNTCLLYTSPSPRD